MSVLKRIYKVVLDFESLKFVPPISALGGPLFTSKISHEAESLA